MDVFEDVPRNLVGRFDVVHIRTFCIVVKNGNPGPLLKNLIEMLSEFTICWPSPRIVLVLHRANPPSIFEEPGGYIQWDEMDCASFSADSPNEHTPKNNADELLRLWQQFAADTHLEFRHAKPLPRNPSLR